MDQVLIIIGSGIFGILGSIHIFLTLKTKAFSGFSEEANEAMKTTSLKITPNSNLWKAWVGVNLSHGLGAVLFAFIYVVISLSDFTFVESNVWFVYVGLFYCLAFTLLSKLYWFKTPFIGSFVSVLCFGVSAIFIHA
jgi:hypothetical protein